MIFRHKKSGDHYRAITRGFSVELQVPVIIYMCLSTGAVFVRAEDDWRKKFHMEYPAESKIEPREKIENAVLSHWQPIKIIPKEEEDILMRWPDGVVMRGKYFKTLGYSVPSKNGKHWVEKIGMSDWKYYYETKGKG